MLKDSREYSVSGSTMDRKRPESEGSNPSILTFLLQQKRLGKPSRGKLVLGAGHQPMGVSWRFKSSFPHSAEMPTNVGPVVHTGNWIGRLFVIQRE